MVNITLNKEDGKLLAIFLGNQSKKDTSYIIGKYNLNINIDEMEDILQDLFEQLKYQIELEM
ncbi:MAG: hypothetical protein SPJ17_05495 [Anaeroplasma sp.]|uniref:hypothetical protein n=1 Tax=Anaeroplasma sp. TaxID=1872523 RepID=UPI002A91F0C3|nr:hypothetical protein [Anaeroplasma sp.]MDY5983131.1 hypothetical protein [Anaeroplasma sp.]